MSKKVKKLFEGILSGILGAGYKAICVWFLKVLFFGGAALYQYMHNLRGDRKWDLITGETYRSAIINIEQNASDVISYLNDNCDQGVYIGYFAPTGASTYGWLYLVSNHKLLTPEAQAIVKAPEALLSTVPLYYKEAVANILKVGKLYDNTQLYSLKELNSHLYHKTYTLSDFDANTFAHFKSSITKVPTKVTEEIRRESNFINNTLESLLLSTYGIDEKQITLYIYKVDSNVNFISILFVHPQNKCESPEKLQKLGNKVYSILKS